MPIYTLTPAARARLTAEAEALAPDFDVTSAFEKLEERASAKSTAYAEIPSRYTISRVPEHLSAGPADFMAEEVAE